MPTSNLVKGDTVFLQVLKFCEHSFLNKQVIDHPVIKRSKIDFTWQKLIKVFLRNHNLNICLESIMDFHWEFFFDFARSRYSMRQFELGTIWYMKFCRLRKGWNKRFSKPRKVLVYPLGLYSQKKEKEKIKINFYFHAFLGVPQKTF